METHIYDEKNGLSYTLHGDYYLPDLVLNEEEPIYGKYGMLRKQFLKEHRLAKYQYLLLTGKLTEHLNQIDQESREQVEMLMEQMAEKQGVTESWWCFPLFAGQYGVFEKRRRFFEIFSKNFLSSKIRLSEKPGQAYRYCKQYLDD